MEVYLVITKEPLITAKYGTTEILGSKDCEGGDRDDRDRTIQLGAGAAMIPRQIYSGPGSLQKLSVPSRVFEK